MIKQAIGMLILGSAFASGVAAALMVDQSQLNTSDPLSGVNNLSGKLQSFQPAATNVAGGGFYFGGLRKDSTGAIVPINMKIALWNGLPGTGSEIASGTVQLSAIGWLDASWTPESVIAGQTYYLALTTVDVPLINDGSPAGGGVEPFINGDLAGSYAGGAPYQFNPTLLPPDSPLQGPYGFDFAFRTYYADTVAPVPLPAAAWLLLSGLAGLGVVGRRKQA